MTKTIENLFILLANYSNFLPIIIFLLFFKFLKSEKSIILIVVSCIIFALLDWMSTVMTGILKIIAYSAFSFFEYFFFSAFLFFHLKRKTSKNFVKIGSVAFLLLLGMYYTVFKMKNIDSVPIGVETLLIMLYCILY